MSRPVVFLGPSLPAADARSILDADYRAPVRRGDIDALADEPPPMIGIVDGLFFQNLAVSPKEILPLLRRGVPVYGASSMGALRAVELAPFGMIGVGGVFELYRTGRIEADDEVAMAYADGDHQPLSEPLVNIRHALALAVERSVLTASASRRLLARMRRTHFSLRSWKQLVRVAEHELGAEASAGLAALRSESWDLKRMDAVELLRRMAADLRATRAESAVVSAPERAPSA